MVSRSVSANCPRNAKLTTCSGTMLGRSSVRRGMKNAVQNGMTHGRQIADFAAISGICSVGTPRWYSHSRVISSPVHSRIGFLTKSPGRSSNCPEIQTTIWLRGCALKWGCRSQFHDITHPESRKVERPPLTCRPLKAGDLLDVGGDLVVQRGQAGRRHDGLVRLGAEFVG